MRYDRSASCRLTCLLRRCGSGKQFSGQEAKPRNRSSRRVRTDKSLCCDKRCALGARARCPTFAGMGLPALSYSNWAGLFAPSSVRRLHFATGVLSTTVVRHISRISVVLPICLATGFTVIDPLLNSPGRLYQSADCTGQAYFFVGNPPIGLTTGTGPAVVPL
jgi:hypothetical protein